MAELTMTHGMPQKVLRKALALGVHNDCLVTENVCPPCEATIMLAFDFFYSHLPSSDAVMRAILDDLHSDLGAED